MPHNTLSIGGATYDLFVRTGNELNSSERGQVIELVLGSKIHVKEIIECCGGGACNTSIGLRRLGCDAAFCGVVGSDQWGEKLAANLRSEGVNVDSMTVVEGETSGFSIILSVESGERVILYAPGANDHLHAAGFDQTHAAGADWIYLNHIQEKSCPIEDDLLRVLEQKETGLTWNPGGCQLRLGCSDKRNQAVLAHTDLLLVNKEEALSFAHATSIEEALRILSSLGVGIVCISEGKRGATATDGKQVYHCPSDPNAHVVDTTGAGDAFGSGMTWALVNQMDLPAALQAGTMNATSVLGTIGAEAGLLTETDMRKKLTDIRLDVHVRPL